MILVSFFSYRAPIKWFQNSFSVKWNILCVLFLRPWCKHHIRPWTAVTFFGRTQPVPRGLLLLAKWWSMGFWSVHPRPSGCSPLDVCPSHWFSTASPSCLWWIHVTNRHATNAVRSRLASGTTWMKQVGAGQPIWHVAGQEPGGMMNGGFCEDSDINLLVHYVSWLHYKLPHKKNPYGRFSILDYTNTDNISFFWSSGGRWRLPF